MTRAFVEQSDIPVAASGHTYWRRKADGVLYEIVHQSRRTGDFQMRRAGATNLKNTNWIKPETLNERYQPADAPPPPTLAERVIAEIGIPERATATVGVNIDFPLGRGAEWGPEAVEFVRRYPDAWWKWMDVPSNAQRNKQKGWWSLDLFAKTDGVKLHMNGPGGWTLEQAQALTKELDAAKEDNTPPSVEPDHRCPCCAHGWSDDG